MLITTQIRSTWIPVLDVCSTADLKGVEETFILILITDLILLVTMLTGLLRLRRHGGGTRGLGLLLWKQVRCWPFSHGCDSRHQLM